MALKLRELNRAMHVKTRVGVGSIRSRIPAYVSLMPPCNHACPAGENIQGWLSLAQDGQYEAAWHLLKAENPLPAIHGRACYHPCETHCNRGEMDDAVAIHEIERFLGDMALESGWSISCDPPSGRSVLVVGSGPAGLSCAYNLARSGHRVEIVEAATHPGGMLAYGIPSYRLPAKTVQRELDEILSLPGITLRCNRRVTDLKKAMAEGSFDAAFIAVGAAKALTMALDTEDGRRPIEAIDLLHSVREGERPDLGQRVVVVGGGNVAMDAARTARRLGAKQVVMVYRRDEAHMSALPEEREAAEIEGVSIRYCSIVKRFTAKGVEIEAVTLDESGRPVPGGELALVPADTVVLAIGQHADLSLCLNVGTIAIDAGERVEVDRDLMTGMRGVFAGGDCIEGARTMTTATGHGKKAARAIDRYLTALTTGPAPMPDEGSSSMARKEIVSFAMLQMPALLMAPREEGASLPVSDRAGFKEIIAGLNEKQARHEAGRCLSCGNCFECDNCFAVCAEQAIRRLGPGKGYAVDETLCTGCGDCAQQCPCHAIEMHSEPLGDSPVMQDLPPTREGDQAVLQAEFALPGRFTVRA